MVGFWEVASAACGVIYLTAWSSSFYPQIILNHRRRSTLGFSPDFALVNPIGFFCLTVWCWGAFVSKTAREQYAERHHGHHPQVSISDLAFSMHALVLSTITLIQSAWYFHRHRQQRKNPTPGESHPLLQKEPDMSAAPTAPHTATQVGLVLIALVTLYEITSLAMGRTQLLDFLYYASTIKLVITTIKYLPQAYLNYRIKTVIGFAISTIFLDITGGLFSLLQLVISSVFIDQAPSGIWANPGKLGLSLLTLGFDTVFILQKYVFYPEEEEYDEDDE